jgi:hypothetical protein
MHAHNDLLPGRHESFPSKRLTEAQTPQSIPFHTLQSHQSLIQSLKAQPYVTDEKSGRRYWTRLTVQYIEVSDVGEIMD